MKTSGFPEIIRFKLTAIRMNILKNLMVIFLSVLPLLLIIKAVERTLRKPMKMNEIIFPAKNETIIKELTNVCPLCRIVDLRLSEYQYTASIVMSNTAPETAENRRIIDDLVRKAAIKVIPKRRNAAISRLKGEVLRFVRALHALVFFPRWRKETNPVAISNINEFIPGRDPSSKEINVPAAESVAIKLKKTRLHSGFFPSSALDVVDCELFSGIILRGSPEGTPENFNAGLSSLPGI